jgi:hypothetical protein
VRHKIVVEKDIGLLDGSERLQGEKFRVSGASADQGYSSVSCSAWVGKRCARQLARGAGI